MQNKVCGPDEVKTGWVGEEREITLGDLIEEPEVRRSARTNPKLLVYREKEEDCDEDEVVAEPVVVTVVPVAEEIVVTP